MSTTPPARPTAGQLASAPRGAAPRRHPGAGSALAVAGVLLVVGAVLGARWWTHPALFDDSGDAFVADPVPVAEAALNAGVVFPPADPKDEAVVTIRSVRAHFVTNTARATASFSICRGGGTQIGDVHGDLHRYCPDVVPLDEPTGFRYAADSGDVLVLTVSPRQAGRARVDGVHLDYTLDGSHLWQRGGQTIAVDVTARAR